MSLPDGEAGASLQAIQAYRKVGAVSAIRALERLADALMAEAILLGSNPKRLSEVDPHQYAMQLQDRSDEIEEAVELLQELLAVVGDSGEQLSLPIDQAGPDKLP